MSDFNELTRKGMASFTEQLEVTGVPHYIKILQIQIPDAHPDIIEGIEASKKNNFELALKKFLSSE